MIIYRILLLTLLIMTIYSCLIYVLYEKELEEKQPEPEERNNYYLKLQNMTTQEILLFKKKDDFIKDVGCYEILRNFYNDDEIIKKIYPNYKRLD